MMLYPPIMLRLQQIPSHLMITQSEQYALTRDALMARYGILLQYQLRSVHAHLFNQAASIAIPCRTSHNGLFMTTGGTDEKDAKNN
jgi:hypothetical protein